MTATPAEVEAGDQAQGQPGLYRVLGQPGVHSETLSQKNKNSTGEMAQSLRGLTVFTEDPSSVPSTHTRQLITDYNLGEFDTLSPVCVGTCTHYTYIHIIKIFSQAW